MNLGNKLINAAKEGNCDKITEILNMGIDINYTVDPEFQCTALHWASMQGHTRAVDLLLSCPGVDINIKDASDWTPLHQATRNNSHPYVIQRLIQAGANINAKDVNGDDPYDIAVKYNPPIQKHFKEIVNQLEEKQNLHLQVILGQLVTALVVNNQLNERLQEDNQKLKEKLEASNPKALERAIFSQQERNVANEIPTVVTSPVIFSQRGKNFSNNNVVNEDICLEIALDRSLRSNCKSG